MTKFAEIDDVTARFEGEMPSERTDWVETAIGDVEQALMGLVTSLRKPIADIDADSVAAGDLGRLERVKSLVCHKVLDLFRNPDRSQSQSQSMGEFSVTRSYYGRYGSGNSAVISFTDAELDSVKLRRKRSAVGTMFVAPWCKTGC